MAVHGCQSHLALLYQRKTLQAAIDHQMLDHLLEREQIGLQPVAGGAEKIVDLGTWLPLRLVAPAVEGSSGVPGREPTTSQDLSAENSVIHRLLHGEHAVYTLHFSGANGSQEPGPVPGGQLLVLCGPLGMG